MNRGSYIREQLVPRVVYIPYWISKVLLTLVCFVVKFTRRSESEGRTATICIEAGVRGWESIEFGEYYKSACEYLSAERVVKLVVQSGAPYLAQVHAILKGGHVTHYLHDPRTGAQSNWKALFESFALALMFEVYDVVPIVLSTDVSTRRWRAQSAIITSRRGVVVSFISAKAVAPIYPHNRLLGPCLMPFSVETKTAIESIAAARSLDSDYTVRFIGALYEPRATVLRTIQDGLANRGITFEIKGRVVGEPRVSDTDYWTRLAHSDVIVTTAEQGTTLPGCDWMHIPQLVYRYLEVLVAGSVLVAPVVPGVSRYFTPGEHFVPFEDPQSAVSAIEALKHDRAERLRIAASGRKRAEALILARCFWCIIDSTLGKDSIY